MTRKILIVDDHDDLATELQTVFNRHGHEVKTLESREEALHLHHLQGFDVIITDLDNYDEQQSTEDIHVFKIGAANLRSDFDENELHLIVETTLDYKAKFLDDRPHENEWREKIEFELPSAIAPMHSILNYLQERLAKMGVIERETSNVFIALDEAFVNAVKHGNRFNHEKIVKISAEISPSEARFTVEDEGEGFDVSAIPDPLDPENLFKTSGRGVLLIQNIMDEVSYNERGNQVTMIKRSTVSKVKS
ncbi:MAG: ATP-binding protein [Pyrinomonadaceae bacterium]|nr:ATP-binding protein [Pyrinomonadaceae bacterium]